MAVILTDQVTAPAGVTAGGAAYACGDVLPAGDQVDPAVRDALRGAGLLRPVTVADTVTDLAGQALAAAVADPQVIVAGDLAAAYQARFAGADSAPGGGAPGASFTYTPAAPGTTTLVTFDASASAPGTAGEPITRYDWQFDTRAAKPDGGPSVTWRLPSSHGSYTVTLTVTAADGQTGLAEQVITI